MGVIPDDSTAASPNMTAMNITTDKTLLNKQPPYPSAARLTH